MSFDYGRFATKCVPSNYRRFALNGAGTPATPTVAAAVTRSNTSSTLCAMSSRPSTLPWSAMWLGICGNTTSAAKSFS